MPQTHHHSYQRHRRRPAYWRGDALTLCLATLVVLVGAYGMYDVVTAPASDVHTDARRAEGQGRAGTAGFLGAVFGGAGMQLCPGKDTVNVLILGTDERTEGGRADTIMLVIIHKQTKRIAAVSVPRDLMVRLPGHGTQKINAIYAFNRRDGTGEAMTAQAVSQILGVPVDYYLKTDVTKFPKLFDAFGGLDLYVDRDMEYHDSWGHLDIDLRKGFQHLNGRQIEGFVRHRHDKHGHYSSDYERNQRQQYVLKELIKQKGNWASATRLPQIVYTLREMISTNMSVTELMELALLGKQCDIHHIISRMVPTHPRMAGAWYAVLEPEGTRRMMAEVQRGLAGEPVGEDPSPERNEAIGGGELNRPVGDLTGSR